MGFIEERNMEKIFENELLLMILPLIFAWEYYVSWKEKTGKRKRKGR